MSKIDANISWSRHSARSCNGSSEQWTTKQFTCGTHRIVEPATLLSTLRLDLARYGITRIARLTGLDRIGIEVFAVIRPNARGLSVAQGKGCTRDAAELSGVMEAIELWHAENPTVPLSFGPVSRVPDALTRQALDAALGRPVGEASIYWCQGTDLISGRSVSVPFDLVHSCFTDDARVVGTKFPVSTNGLASGANRDEALIHALCEIIERHDTAVLAHGGARGRAERALDLASVEDPVPRELLESFAAAEIAVRVWDATGEMGIATCVAAIADRRDTSAPAGFGAGCHPSRSVALSRALTEAAQARLTRISGARDDLLDEFFGSAAGTRARWLTEPGVAAPRRFNDLPDVATAYIERDLIIIVDALSAAGLDPVVAVDLSTDPHFSVVRAIVPGLYGYEVEQ